MVDTNQVIDIIISGSLNKVVVAVVTILIGLLIGRLMASIAFKILTELKTNKIIKENFGIKMSVEQLVSKIIYYLIIIASLTIALNQLGLSKIILYLILALILLTLISFIIIAFKEFIPQIIAFLWIYQKKIVKIGEIVEIKNIKGKIVKIGLTEIKLTANGDIIHIPNSLLFKEKVRKLNE